MGGVTSPRIRRAGFARARSVLATSTVMARTTGALFAVSGILGIVVATQIPDGPPGDVHVVFGVAAAAVVIGMGVASWGHLLRPALYHPLVAGGTIMVTIVIFESTSSVAAVAFATLYVSVAIDVCVFFTWALAAAHVIFAVICCMSVLALLPGTPWWAGVVASGATIGVGIVVGFLSRVASDADVDALTGLLNRRGFDRALNLHIAAAERTGVHPVLVVLTMDRFHMVNDTYGYRSGDEVLQHVVEAWLPLLGPEDILARPGGDRFALLLPATNEGTALALTERLRASVSPRCSAGVTSWQPGDSASFTVSRADVALYRAKLGGGNRTLVEPSGQAPLAVLLAKAIAERAVDVVYQPVVDLTKDANVCGIEALLRWAPPGHPDVTTTQIVRVAEETGLVAELDHYVLRRACVDALVLQGAKTDGPLMLNVNVSGLELVKPGYVDDRVQRPARHRMATGSVGARSDRKCARRRHARRDRGFARTAHQGHPGRDRRLRDRLLVVEQDPESPDGPSQTRPVIPRRHHQ